MADRSAPFIPAMSIALRDGRKTQTRRHLQIRGHKTFSEFGPSTTYGYDWHFRDAQLRWHDYRHDDLLKRLPYQVGDRIAVCEEHYAIGHWVPNGLSKTGRQKWRFVHDLDEVRFDPPETFRVSMDKERPQLAQWYRRLGRFMFRRHSRLTLTVTEVRVQRLQEITFDDTLAEGIEATDIHARRLRACLDGNGPCGSVCRDSFQELWNSLHGPDAWDANPWVVAVSFTVEHRNIDEAPNAD